MGWQVGDRVITAEGKAGQVQKLGVWAVRVDLAPEPPEWHPATSLKALGHDVIWHRWHGGLFYEAQLPSGDTATLTLYQSSLLGLYYSVRVNGKEAGVAFELPEAQALAVAADQSNEEQ